MATDGGLSREDARILIGKTKEDNGGISPADRAICPPAVLRAGECAAMKTLATNLYSKDTRFVYELIQNAEDNEYTRAEGEGFTPCWSSTPTASLLSHPEKLALSPVLTISIQDTRYTALLERVIQSAGRMTIPIYGSDSLDSLQSASPGGTLFASAFGTRSPDRDRKVGAAGELLDFEILSNLNFEGFSERNWKSTTRKEVRVHNKYHNLEEWLGRETAGITFSHTMGDLTELFVEKGQLQSNIWGDARPTYYLEVNTTTRGLSEQFYMSGSQYKRMQKMEFKPGKAALEVYVILRVLNLDGKIGLKLYIDPEPSRQQGELKFEVDTWVVKHEDI